MDAEGAVLEAPEISTGVETAEGVSSGESSQAHQESQQDDPYSSKASREYSAWLKEMREAAKDDPRAAKFLRLSKDNHARLFQLQQMEAKGIDGIREKYAVLDSVTHGDLKGVEAIGALQDELRAVQDTDRRLFEGDVEALKEMGEEFTAKALPKLAGPILDMVRESSPSEYAAAVLPHFVDALQTSDLLRNHNAIIDILNEQPPKWLPADKLAAWTEDKNNRLAAKAEANSAWFNTQAAKARELPRLGAKPGETAKTPEQTELEERRKGDETAHWKQNITPGLDRHADKKFDELFRPFAKRLRLDKSAASALKQEFVQGVTQKAKANPAYTSQMQRYHAQSKPDANTVLNFARVEFDKHGKSVLDALVKTRYGSFLNGGKQAARPAPAGGAKLPPVAPGVQIVTVKPKNIDFKSTPLSWIHQKKYKTTDGKVVQVRP